MPALEYKYKTAPTMMNEPLSTIMTTDLITVGPDDNLYTCRKILLRKRFHHLPVVDGENLAGLISTYDLFKQEHCPRDFDKILVRDIMTTRLATLEPHQKIGIAAEIFLEHLFQAVPIVTNGKKLVGIVTSYDVMRYEFFKAYPRHY